MNPVIPADSTVYAFSDPHGVRSGLVAAMRGAGLIDVSANWIAPARTALVGVGDYIDRGTDSAGILGDLERWRIQAQAAGSLVVACRGNHEEMLLGIIEGESESYKLWITDFAGGIATARSLSVDPIDLMQGVGHLRDVLRELHPELGAQLRAMPDFAIWRDTLFCHAGPVANLSPDLLARAGNEHLWQFPAFDRPDLEEFDLSGDLFDGYRRAGITRFVYGHESHDGPGIYQDGRALCLDTNTNGGAEGVGSATFVLAKLSAGGSLGRSQFATIDTRNAPDASGL